MADIKARAKALMRRVRAQGRLPPSRDIVDEAFANLGLVEGKVPPDDVIRRFSFLLHGVWKETLRVLERYEESVYAAGIPRELAEEAPDAVRQAAEVAEREDFRAGALCLLRSWYPLLRECFLSVSQSRKARGGKDFELQIEQLLALAEIPFTKQDRTSRIDLVVPSMETYERTPNEAVIVSLKRTLRERDVQVLADMYRVRARYAYLLTAEDKLQPRHLTDARANRVYLVVWDSVKEGKYASVPDVLGFTQWANQHLLELRSLRHRPDRTTP
jgi:hypothetical protein